MPLSEKFYNQLNEKQVEAVKHFDGPSLILAGAGSGKTRVLVYRIAALVLEKQADIQNILAVTFTNKAAREMKDRVNALLNEYNYYAGYTPWIGTFHSVCAQLLRQNMHLMSERESLTIYDSSDQLRLIKNVLKNLNVDEKMHDPKTFRHNISLCKRQAVLPHNIDEIPYLARDNLFIKVYKEYENKLKEASAFDFDSLLLETYHLMKTHPDFLEKLQNQFRYICVDEYQDTNHIQYLLIKKLSEKHKNISVVGDEDQSIYSWRGADITNIINFEKDFKDCKIYFLEENYRSTRNIVDGATALIANNVVRKGKTLFTHKEDGEKILIKETLNEYEEGRFVSQTIRYLCHQGDSAWQDFAVLYRTNAQSRSLEDHFRILQIPYKIVGGVKFYERAEIKDVLAYLKLVLNTKDDVSFMRVINSPKRGLGKTTLEKIQKMSFEKQCSMYEALSFFVNNNMFKGKAFKESQSFLQTIEDLKKQKDSMPLYEFYIMLLEKTNYLQALKNSNTVETQSRLDNLQELGNVIEQKDKQSEGSLDLESFLEEIGLLTDDDKTKDVDNAVTLMTLHNSKGLEFNNVFVVGLEDGLFPSFQSIEEGNLEEERRLAYVGMTRAMKRLTLSYARKRRVWGKDQYNPPSQFLSEIPEEVIHEERLSYSKYQDTDEVYQDDYDDY